MATTKTKDKKTTKAKKKKARGKVKGKTQAKGKSSSASKATKKKKVATKTSTTKGAKKTSKTTTRGKRSGRPHPHEKQLGLAISRYEKGSEKPVSVSFKSNDEAKKKYSSFWRAFSNRGYAATISVDGSRLSIVVKGKVKAKRGRSSKTAQGTILVRVRKGQGWRYNEFTSGDKAQKFIDEINGSRFDVFKVLPVKKKKVTTTEHVIVGL